MNWIEPKKYLKRFELSEFPQPEPVLLNYPVLMCHGYGGFLTVVTPSAMHHCCMRLRGMGILAFAPNIVPYASIATRAEQWVSIIERLKKTYGFDKFNVVAHSMGGLDMRHAITHLGMDKSVASLTTIATPHRGTSLANLVLNTPEALKEKLADLVDWFGESIYPSLKSDTRAAVEQLTGEYVTGEFNPNTPDIEDVHYFSFSAAVGKGTKQPLNAIYRLQNQLIYQQDGLNDSFVPVQSAKWGTHIETLFLSHLEQIEMQVSKERRPMVEAFWKKLAENLKKNGL